MSKKNKHIKHEFVSHGNKAILIIWELSHECKVFLNSMIEWSCNGSRVFKLDDKIVDLSSNYFSLNEGVIGVNYSYSSNLFSDDDELEYLNENKKDIIQDFELLEKAIDKWMNIEFNIDDNINCTNLLDFCSGCFEHIELNPEIEECPFCEGVEFVKGYYLAKEGSNEQ